MSQLPAVLPIPVNLPTGTAVAISFGKAYHRDPETMSGTPVFVGTRVPVRTLFDYLEAGDNLDVFLLDFPTVGKENAVAVLEIVRQMLLNYAA